jgi:hypothetical protein
MTAYSLHSVPTRFPPNATTCARLELQVVEPASAARDPAHSAVMNKPGNRLRWLNALPRSTTTRARIGIVRRMTAAPKGAITALHALGTSQSSLSQLTAVPPATPEYWEDDDEDAGKESWISLWKYEFNWSLRLWGKLKARIMEVEQVGTSASLGV